MLSINFVGDPHLTPYTPASRKDDYPQTIISKYNKIQECSPSEIQVLLGDVFHKPVLPLKYVNLVADQ